MHTYILLMLSVIGSRFSQQQSSTTTPAIVIISFIMEHFSFKKIRYLSLPVLSTKQAVTFYFELREGSDFLIVLL